MSIRLSRTIPASNDKENYERIFKFSNKLCVIHKMLQVRINTSADWQVFTQQINYAYPVKFDNSPCVIAQVNDDSGDSTFLASVSVKRNINQIDSVSFLRHKATTSDCWISLLIIGILV